MAIKTQIWHPDTCSCIIEQQYDASLPIDEVEHSVKSVKKKCEFHSDLVDDQQVYEVLMEENPRKNIAIANLIENSPVEWIDVDSKTGDKKLKDGIVIDYNFVNKENDNTTAAGERILELSIIGVDSTSLSDIKKTDIQTHLDTTLGKRNDGSSKVVIKEAKPTRNVKPIVNSPSRRPRKQ